PRLNRGYSAIVERTLRQTDSRMKMDEPTTPVEPAPVPTYQFRLDGKRALITGASRGMGRETAKAFARLRANVAVSGRSEAELETLAGEIREEGGTATVLIADVGDVAQAEKLATQAANALGGIDILVNNAGGAAAYIPGGSTGLLGTPPAVFEELFRLNL